MLSTLVVNLFVIKKVKKSTPTPRVENTYADRVLSSGTGIFLLNNYIPEELFNWHQL